MAAIRIDGVKMYRGHYHLDALKTWMTETNTSEEDADHMIESGRLEFGHEVWNCKDNTYSFKSSETRNNMYNTYGDVWENTRDCYD